jgi:DNA-binding XRE family transcriptional regulator
MNKEIPQMVIDPLVFVIARAFRRKAVLTEPEFCKVVGISRTTAYTLREQGKLGYYQEGKNVRYGPQHVLDYLRMREVRATKRVNRAA